MKDFAAIDFETANAERTSVCSVGIVVYRDGKKVDEFYSLIKPEPEYYTYWCSRVHGITLNDTANAPIFPNVWRKIEPKIQGLPLVAHNKAFDESCLKAVFRCYQMDYPDYPFLCTLVQSRKVCLKVATLSTSSPNVADSPSTTTTMHSPMLRLALPSHCRFYKERKRRKL